jgi:hypothetical protein
MTVLTALVLTAAAVATAGFATGSASTRPLGDGFVILGPHPNSLSTGQPCLSRISVSVVGLLAWSVLRCGFARRGPAPRCVAASAPYPGRHHPRRDDRPHGVDHPHRRDRQVEKLYAAR